MGVHSPEIGDHKPHMTHEKNTKGIFDLAHVSATENVCIISLIPHTVYRKP